MPADAIGTDVRGDTIVTVGNQKIWFPRGFAARVSQDHRVHVCFRKEKDLNFLMPLCLFLPGIS